MQKNSHDILPKQQLFFTIAVSLLSREAATKIFFKYKIGSSTNDTILFKQIWH
jgi:hypothetical protein